MLQNPTLTVLSCARVLARLQPVLYPLRVKYLHIVISGHA